MPRKPRADWTKIRDEYVKAPPSEPVTLEELAERHGYHQSTVKSRSSLENWRAQRDMFVERVQHEVGDKVAVQTAVSREVELRTRQMHRATLLQTAGMTSLSRLLKRMKDDPTLELPPHDARMLLVAGLEQERKAAGIDDADGMTDDEIDAKLERLAKQLLGGEQDGTGNTAGDRAGEA